MVHAQLAHRQGAAVALTAGVDEWHRRRIEPGLDRSWHGGCPATLDSPHSHHAIPNHASGQGLRCDRMLGF
jgi:hypothetical protein